MSIGHNNDEFKVMTNAALKVAKTKGILCVTLKASKSVPRKNDHSDLFLGLDVNFNC